MPVQKVAGDFSLFSIFSILNTRISPIYLDVGGPCDKWINSIFSVLALLFFQTRGLKIPEMEEFWKEIVPVRSVVADPKSV